MANGAAFSLTGFTNGGMGADHVLQSRDTGDRGARRHAQGDRAGARAEYLAALELNPQNASAHNNLGFLLAQEGNFEEAFEHYRRALEINPQHSMAMANMGLARAATGDLTGGIEWLRQAVLADSANILAWDNLARLLLKSGLPAEAESAARKALDLAPQQSRFHLTLGLSVAAQQRLAEAAEILRTAATLDPESAQAWEQFGVVLFLRKDLGSARDALRRAVALDPGNIAARRHLSTVLLALGEQDDAESELRSILARDPENVESQVDLAVLAIAHSAWTEALDRADAALRIRTDNPRAYFYRAIALDRLGRRDEASALLDTLAGGSDAKYAEYARDYLGTRSRES